MPNCLHNTGATSHRQHGEPGEERVGGASPAQQRAGQGKNRSCETKLTLYSDSIMEFIN